MKHTGLMAMTLDYQTAFAAAWDHGNRHARTHGRTVLSPDDYDAACAELERLLKLIGGGLMPSISYHYELHLSMLGVWCGKFFTDGHTEQLAYGVSSITAAQKICRRDHGKVLHWKVIDGRMIGS